MCADFRRMRYLVPLVVLPQERQQGVTLLEWCEETGGAI